MENKEMFDRLLWWAKTSLEIMRENGMSAEDEKNIKEIVDIKKIIAKAEVN